MPFIHVTAPVISVSPTPQCKSYRDVVLTNAAKVDFVWRTVATTSTPFVILNCHLLECTWLRSGLHLNVNRVHLRVGVVWKHCACTPGLSVAITPSPSVQP
jgi:hypothetical protein